MADAARTGSHVREQAALADYTTLRLGGPARRLVEAATEAEIVAAVRAADERGEPLLVLGGGSNLVVADEGFPGTVVRVATGGVHHRIATHGARGNGAEANGGDPVELTVAAGEDWDAVVAGCVGEGLAGLECLSGIPGRAGATPIQNVGAYGQEVAERIISVRVYDRARRVVTDLESADCGFGYRTSAFKRSLQATPAAGQAAVTGRFVVLSVRFLLARDLLSAPVRYPELARVLGLPEGGRAPLRAVRSAVLGLRRGKGMVLDPDDPDTRSVGSFFLNPVLDHGQFSALERAARAVAGPGARVPRYPAGDGQVKVSAAWLIEQAGFRKGYPAMGAGTSAAGGSTGGARISSKHTLALVNPGGATTAGLLALAQEIREGVRAAFGVELASEPVLVGAGL
jgi:UDP-N-acetylmuramate dehydrogenase